MQLAKLPLDHALTVYLEESLRALVGQRHKAGAETRRENHRAVHAVGCEIGKTGLRELLSGRRRLRQKSLFLCLGAERVDAAERTSQAGRQGALGQGRFGREFPEQKSKFIHGIISFTQWESVHPKRKIKTYEQYSRVRGKWVAERA